MSFTLANAVTKTRRLLKDNTESVFTDDDIKDFINEGLMLIKNTVPEYFTTLNEVVENADVINISVLYKNLPCIFASARCFEQDEQNYRAVQKMNEFESRRIEMEQQILNSTDYADKMTAEGIEQTDFVVNVYSDSTRDDNDDYELTP